MLLKEHGELEKTSGNALLSCSSIITYLWIQFWVLIDLKYITSLQHDSFLRMFQLRSHLLLRKQTSTQREACQSASEVTGFITPLLSFLHSYNIFCCQYNSVRSKSYSSIVSGVYCFYLLLELYKGGVQFLNFVASRKSVYIYVIFTYLFISTYINSF